MDNKEKQNADLQLSPADNEKQMSGLKEHKQVQKCFAPTHSHISTTQYPVNIDIFSRVSGTQVPSSSFGFSQGSNDVLEVLCSGDPTAGKLLMHFLLFYGQYFDSQSMVIDVTAPDHGVGPFTQRQTGASMDPVTGMLTVDPIVVYDPLDGPGIERSNVARSCFAWSSIRCVFAQCYTTLQHTMERRGRNNGSTAGLVDFGNDVSRLLELLLSF